MKKKTKVLLSLLSVACLSTGALGIASACTVPQNTGDAQIRAVYEQYVAYAEANNETVLTYDQWLTSIKGEKGDKGDQGEPGTPGTPGQQGGPGKSAYQIYLDSIGDDEVPLIEAEWLASLAGKPGTGIISVEYATDGDYLIVTYTDGKTANIELPEKFTHEHSYNGEVVVLIPATSTTDGIGYKMCECGHTELVVIQKYYAVTLLLPNGEPAVGYTVTINESSAVTDEEGTAKITGFGDPAEYAISVTLQDTDYAEGFMLFGETKTSADQLNYTIQLVNELPADEWGYYYVTEANTYGLIIPYEEDWRNPGQYTYTDVNIDLKTDDGVAKKFTISTPDEHIWIADYNGVIEYVPGEPVEVKVGANETFSFTISVDSLNPPEGDASGKPYPCLLNVTTEVLPLGSVDAPVAIEDGVEVQFDAEPNQEVYFQRSSQYDGTKGLIATFGENVSLFHLGTNVNELSEPIASGEGFSINEYYTTYYKASATDGHISFTLDKYIFPGEMGNPIPVELGKTATETVDVYTQTKWFSYTPTENCTIVFEKSPATQLGIFLEDGLPMSAWDSGTQVEYESISNRLYVDMTANTKYYIQLGNETSSGEASFTARTFDSTKDAGYRTTDPMTLNVGDNAKTGAYFTFTATAYGRVTVKPTLGGEAVANSVAICSAEYASAVTELAASQSLVVKENTIVYIYIDPETLPADASNWNIGVTFKPLAAADHNVTVQCGETPIAGVTVKAMDGDTLIQSAVTNASGVATLNMLPGSYNLELENLPAEYNYRAKVSTTVPADESHDAGADYTIEVEAKSTRTFTLKATSGEVISGVIVKIMNGETVVVSGQTNENGTVALEFFNGDYTIILEGLDETKYRYQNTVTLNPASAAEIEISVETYGLYEIEVLTPDNLPVSNVTVTLEGAGKVIGTGTTGENGKWTMTGDPVLLKQYIVTVTGFDSNYYIVGTIATEWGNNKLTVKLTEKTSYSITVVDQTNTKIANASVVVLDGTTVAATGTTDENGVCTVKLIPGRAYTVRAISADAALLGKSSIAEDATTASVTLSATVALEVKTYDTPTDQDSATEYTCTEAGTYTFAMSVSGFFMYSVNGTAVEYSMSGSFTVTLQVGDTIKFWSTVAAGSTVTVTKA